MASDLAGDPRSLTDGELESLWRVWQSQKKDLAEREVLSEFEQRRRREWAIETGIIEDVYTLDRGVTRTLIEKGIDAAFIPHGTANKDPVLVARVIQDHYETLEGMFDFIGGQRSFSAGYVKELHAALLRNQDVHAFWINSARFLRNRWKRAGTSRCRTTRRVRTAQCMSTVRPSTWAPKWMSSSECTRNTSNAKYHQKSKLHGCTTASRRFILSLMATAVWRARSPV